MDSTISTTRKSLGPTEGEPGERVDVLCEYQRKLSAIFGAEGYRGVGLELLDIARREIERGRKTSSWSKLKEFGGGGRYGQRDWLTFYLYSMDRGFLEALMEGQIGRRMFEKGTLTFNVSRRHQLKETPQIYVNICSRKEFWAVGSTQEFEGMSEAERRKWAGYGLTPMELGQVLRRMEKYVDHQSTDPTAKEQAKEIDACMMLKPSSKLPEHARKVDRKYLTSDRSIEVIRDWVINVRQKVVRAARLRMGPSQFAEPFPWCFQEIGFGQHGAGRGSMHAFHDGTNYLFGLFTACAMTLFPDVFEIKTFAVMDVFYPEHADPCEILGSLCGGTYGHGEWMGLNPALAGGNNMQGQTGLLQSKLAPHFEKNRKDAADPLIFRKNREEDRRRQERFNKVFDADLEKLEYEAAELGKKVAKEKEELTEDNKIVNRLTKARSLSELLYRKRKSPPEAAECGPEAKSARTAGSD